MTTYVEIRQAGRRIAVQEGGTIPEAALADSIAYPHGFRSGRCGSCKSPLVSGEVDLLDHSRFALSDEEKAQGLILACRANPRTDAIVVWLGGDEETASNAKTLFLAWVIRCMPRNQSVRGSLVASKIVPHMTNALMLTMTHGFTHFKFHLIFGLSLSLSLHRR